MAFPLKKICDKTKSEYLYQAKCAYVVYLTYAPLLCLDTVEYRHRIITLIEPENVAVINIYKNVWNLATREVLCIYEK